MIRMGNMWTTSNVPNEFNNDIWKRLKQVICSKNASVIDSEMELSVYPNPCTNSIHLGSENELSNFQITNIYGQKIMEGRITNPIDVQALNSGIYFLKLADEKSSVNIRRRFQKKGL